VPTCFPNRPRHAFRVPAQDLNRRKVWASALCRRVDCRLV
jgi:hypothetical protein